MAFPDYGPIEMITQYTQDGFRQAAFLFHLYAGNITDSKALHYIGVMFAMIGFVAIVMIKKYHNFKTIGCWTLVLFLLLMGPFNNKTFFYPIDINVISDNNKEANVETVAFTPQLATVHFMSQIHRALYVAFFDIDPTKPGLRNFVNDVSYGAGSFDSASTNVNDRPDVQQEIYAYASLCGDANNLSYELYDDTWENNVKAANAAGNADLDIDSRQLSAAKTWKLQQTIFKIGDFNRLIDNYEKQFQNSNGIVYPPFVAINLKNDELKQSLLNSGVAPERAEEEEQKHLTSRILKHYKEFYNDISYYLTDRERIESGSGISVISGGQNSTTSGMMQGYITFDPSNSDDQVILNHGATPDEMRDAAEALAKLANDADLEGLYPTSTWDDLSQPDQVDPFEQRLDGRKHFKVQSAYAQTGSDHTMGYDGASPGSEEERKWTAFLAHGDATNVREVAASFVFMTPSMKAIYAQNESKVLSKGGVNRSIDNLSDKPYFNTVTNCAQLHQLARVHLLDSILYKNAWPNHEMAVNVTNSRGVQRAAKPGKIADRDGFQNYVGNYYRVSPYNAWGGENLSPNLNAINQRIQIMASQLQITTGTPAPGAPAQSQNAMQLGGAIGAAAAEALRRDLAGSLIKNALTYSFMPGIKRASGEEVTVNRNMENMNNAISNSFSGAGVRENLPGMSSGLSYVADWFSGIFASIGANFAGIGAVAYIRFLQIFVAIGLFFIIMCTPILFMMGLILPHNAPGVLATSIMAPLALKAVPIGFTLVDAVISIALGPSAGFFVIENDKAILMYVVAGAYTSVTMVTFFLLFKAGDTQAVVGKLSELDKGANQIADTGVTATKVVAGAAVAGGAAGVMGAVGAAKAGGSLSKMASVGMRQGAEVFGARGAQAIPGAGNFAQEIATSYREGKGQATVMGEVDKANQNIDAQVSKLDAKFNGGNSNMSIDEYQSARSNLLDQKRSYNELITASKDDAAESKYRGQTNAGANYFAAGRAEQQFEEAAAAQGMSRQEARRLEREASALASTNSTLTTAVQEQKIQDANVTIEDAKIDGSAATLTPTQMQAIAKGERSARFAMHQSKRTGQEEVNAIISDYATSTNQKLGADTDGPVRKNTLPEVTTTGTNRQGETVTFKSPQDNLNDQGGSAIKDVLKTQHKDAISGINSVALTKVTEEMSAREFVKHAKGDPDFKLDLRPEVRKIIEKHNGKGAIENIETGRKASSFIIRPGTDLYNDLTKPRFKVDANGNKTETTLMKPNSGHAISLMNEHLTNSASVHKATIKEAEALQAKIEEVEKAAAKVKGKRNS